jgi:hypothetical protein
MVNLINQDIPRNVAIGIQTTQKKLKDKKEVAVNGVLAQLGGTRNKSNNK